MEHNVVSFKYHIGQEIYFLHKDYPKRGYISEINICIQNMYEDDGWVIEPIIEYRIKGNEIIWIREDELWENRKDFQKWIDTNLCTRKNVKFENDTALWLEDNFDDGGIKVKVLEIIDRINNKHPWKRMMIAEIFYFDKNGQAFFRYVPFDDIELINEKNTISETKYELMKIYGMNYIEDGIYNFVNYDGIKL